VFVVITGVLVYLRMEGLVGVGAVGSGAIHHP
jgi:hypothetical protein